MSRDNQQLCVIRRISRIVEFAFARIMYTPIEKMLRCRGIKRLIISRAHGTRAQGEIDRVVGDCMYNVQPSTGIEIII